MTSLDELWAHHVADPGDLSHRAVLADALTEAGDVRGELITLQMAIADGRANPQMIARANELITEHRAAWSAAFPGATADVKFRRGFPVRVTTNAKGAGLDRTIDRPDWVTVEELGIHGADADLPRLLSRMPLLRVLISSRDVVESLAQSGRVFPSIRTIAAGNWLPGDRAAFPNLAVVAGRWLTYHETAELAAAQRAAAAVGLEAVVHYCMLHVPQHIVEVVASRRVGPPETRCAILNSEHGSLDHQGWYVQTWRDREDALVGFRGSAFETESLRRIAEPLAAVGIRRIALALPLTQHARQGRDLVGLRRDIERRGVTIARAAAIDILAPATVPGG